MPQAAATGTAAPGATGATAAGGATTGAAAGGATSVAPAEGVTVGRHFAGERTGMGGIRSKGSVSL